MRPCHKKKKLPTGFYFLFFSQSSQSSQSTQDEKSFSAAQPVQPLLPFAAFAPLRENMFWVAGMARVRLNIWANQVLSGTLKKIP